ncbi:hypothetical protein TNIN_328551 [Trichonephila inaurata madagascariensis]|uniref:Uncharacterized protein n=1 Tax=Trichonephila inaurata madagascariensis TaxID=2747483 RepID=A0A8X7CMS8_9ARAC|nr:hypothetical protein TNIN_328551 [Trichonephila inaurata madagascariensis]
MGTRSCVPELESSSFQLAPLPGISITVEFKEPDFSIKAQRYTQALQKQTARYAVVRCHHSARQCQADCRYGTGP